MSKKTQAAFHEALAGHIPDTELGRDELVAAAQAHVASHRSSEEILAEYAPLLEGADRGDPEQFQALGEELQAARQAESVAAGNLPSNRAPAVTITEG